MEPSILQKARKAGFAVLFLVVAQIHSAKAQTVPDLSSFQASVTIDKPSFFLGENVLLHYCLVNKSNATGQIWIGSPADIFKVTATDETGRGLPEAPWRVVNADSLLAPEPIGPGKQWCQAVALNENVRIDKGGTFTVRVSFNVDNSYTNFRTKGTANIPFVLRAVVAHTTVTLLMPTEGQAQTLIGEMERLQSGPLGMDFSAMRYDVYLAPLLKRVQAGNIPALRGISRILTSQATNALIELSKNGTPDIANQAGSYLKQRLLDLAKSCINASPGNYRSVWGSPLNFDQMQFSAQQELDHVNVFISEKAARGKPQGMALDVNVRTGDCINFTNRLE